MHLIIDSDPITYRAGFSAERTDYHLIVESPAGTVSELHFTPKPGAHAGEQMRKWLKARPKWTVLDKSRDVHPEAEESAIDNTRTQIQSIEKACREEYALDSFDQITIVLSGPGNYRERLATIFPYKGNRDPEHKPYHYQAIRNHLTRDWGAIVVHGREADDECSILANGYIRRNKRHGFIVATIDKDLDQIPGYHYNYLKAVHHTQSVDAARAFFWQQVLSGDATDGVPGCWKIGDGKTRKFIERYGEYSDGNIWEAIVRSYAESQRISGCPYVDRDPAAVALETARLVYLQKEEGELWVPGGPPHDRLPEYKDDDV